MPSTYKGKAQLAGSNITLNVVLYPVANALKLSHKWDDKKLKDVYGDDMARRANNEMLDGEVNMILVDQSTESAVANAKAGAMFLAPLATVMVTECDNPTWVGTWTYVPGSDIGQQNTEEGKMTYKLERYVDSTQNTLMTSTPG